MVCLFLLGGKSTEKRCPVVPQSEEQRRKLTLLICFLCHRVERSQLTRRASTCLSVIEGQTSTVTHAWPGFISVLFSAASTIQRQKRVKMHLNAGNPDVTFPLTEKKLFPKFYVEGRKAFNTLKGRWFKTCRWEYYMCGVDLDYEIN